MPTYFLRVKGVNHRHVIDDTDDLSTRRGGSLLLLNAVVQLAERPPATLGRPIATVATGASVGLFTFEAADPADAEGVRAAAEAHLRTETLEYANASDGGTGHLPLRHATFVVDVAPVGDAPAAAEQVAVAGNRWRQMREPSLSLDGLWGGAGDACAYDRVRPAVRQIKAPDRPHVSASVAARWEYGREARQRFYEHELQGFGPYPGYRFTPHFQAMSAAGGPDDGAAPENTRDKLAVFYVDGNNFGKKGREILDRGGPGEYGKWSAALRDHHRTLLRDLLGHATGAGGWTTPGGEVRLETLLWGGDEILWVVPAWKGWELVEWFFSRGHAAGGRGLSYGCGLVFCHDTAPIGKVTDLAHRLGDVAKAAGRVGDHHRLAYEVLESFDDITDDFDRHRAKWLPPGTDPAVLVLDPGQPPAFWEALRGVAASPDLPVRQLYMLVRAWREGKVRDREASDARLCRCGAGPQLATVLAAFPTREAGWLHLLQMLPYVPPRAVR